MTERLPRVGAIIVAAGSGQRFGDPEKILTRLAGRRMLWYSLDTILSIQSVAQVVIVVGEHTTDEVADIIAEARLDDISVCNGGATRRESVRAGFAMLGADIDLVLIHDAARPFADVDLMKRVIEAATRQGAAVPGIAVDDTVYQVSVDSIAEQPVNRDRLIRVQTPQVARHDWLAHALQRTDGVHTDEGSSLIACGYPVEVVPGCQDNIKITWPGDVEVAESIIARRGL